MFRFICLLLITSFTCTSCCTLVRGSEQKILVDSSPQGAAVTIDGYDCGVTPQYVCVEKNQPHRVLIEKDGYQSFIYYLQPKTSLAVTANALTPITTGALGAGIGLLCCEGDGMAQAIVVPVFFLAGVVVGAVIGVIGSGVDLYTGAGKTLDVDHIHAELHP